MAQHNERLQMASFLVFFKVFGSAVAVYPPKSGYCSAEAPYFDFELQILVAGWQKALSTGIS